MRDKWREREGGRRKEGKKEKTGGREKEEERKSLLYTPHLSLPFPSVHSHTPSLHLSFPGKDPETDKQGMEAVEAVLKEARKIAKTLAPEQRTVIEQLCSEIEALSKELAELQARGEVCVCACVHVHIL